MQLEVRKHLADALLAAQRIMGFTRGKDLAAYRDGELLRSAVERQFVVIGEAMVRIRQTAPDILDGIIGSRRIIRFRNLLVHGYDIVSHETVWDVVTGDLPRQASELDGLVGS